MTTEPLRDPASSVTPSPLTRRTLLTGAAWSVPAVAAAVVAPAAAASAPLVLTLNKSTYSGTACQNIAGAYVTATVKGAAVGGIAVTTTLAGGYVFDSGSTTSTQVSDSNGRVNLPTITVPSQGNPGAITTSAPGSSGTSAAITSTAASSNVVGLTFFSDALPAFPAGVTPVQVKLWGSDNFTAYALGDNGTLYRSHGTDWATVAAGVTSFALTAAYEGVLYATASTVKLNQGPTLLPNFPSGVTPTAVGYGWDSSASIAYALGSDSILYRSSGPASADSAFGAWTAISPAGVTGFSVDTQGSGAIFTTGSSVTASWSTTAIPALPNSVSATSVGYSAASGTANAYFLGNDGTLYRSTNSANWTKVSTGTVTSFRVGVRTTGAVYSTGATVGTVGLSGNAPTMPSGVTATAVGFASEFDDGDCIYMLGSDGLVYRSVSYAAWSAVSPARAKAMTMGSVAGAIFALRSTC